MKKLLMSQKEYLRAYSSDDINNMVGGDAWVHHMWSGDFLYLQQGLADDPDPYDFESPRRASRSTPTPTRSPRTPSTPAPRWSSSTTCCVPRTP